MKRGSIVFLLTAVLLMCVCTISSMFALRILKSHLENTRQMVEVSLKRGVLESARRLLKFSAQENRTLEVELNGYFIETKIKDDEWCAFLKKEEHVEIIHVESR